MSSKAASGENRARIRKEIDLSSGTKSLCLSHCGLAAIPKDVFARSDEFLTSLRLLDLSFNNIITISPDVSLMRSLRELWLSNNPNLTILPDSISQLLKLEVLDIRSTMVKSVPPSFCQLNFLFQFTWDSTPLESELITNYKIAVNDVTKLKDQLYQIYTRSGLETKLLDDLTSEHFAKESDRPHINDFITDLVRQLSVMFPDLKDFQYFVKRAMTMLPEKSSDINEISLQITKDKFYNMRKDTHRKRLAADVEIKLRGFYFDRIERKEVTECIDSMYHHILLLEDIQFFIKYATSVLPAQPEDATGEKIWRNILELQKDLIDKRNAAINSLASAMSNNYPEQAPEVIKAKATEVAQLFQTQRFTTKSELNKYAQITAELPKIFPVDFLSIDYEDIVSKAKIIFAKNK